MLTVSNGTTEVLVNQSIGEKKTLEKPQTVWGLLGKLTKLSKDLLYFSEAEYGYIPVFWGKKELTPETVKQNMKRLYGRAGDIQLATEITEYQINSNTRVEKESFEDFFRGLIKTKPGSSPEDVRDAKKYKAVYDEMKKNLGDLQVFRLGDINPNFPEKGVSDTGMIFIYIVGKTASGSVAGLVTGTVET